MIRIAALALTTGAESVNCGATQERYTDTHIEVVATSGTTARSRRVFVEVTPRWRDYMASQGRTGLLIPSANA